MAAKPIKIYAEVIEPEAMDQFYRAMALPCNVQGALMPDTHTGYTLPIGAVIKSDRKIFPSYVGYDIGCGMCAVRLDVEVAKLTKKQLEDIRDGIVREIPLGPNKHKSSTALPESIRSAKMTPFAWDVLKHTGGYQLGTLGGGNHFIELGSDQDGYLNIVIHSGSRGVGYKIAEHYMKEAAMADVDEQRYIDEFNNNPKNLVWCQHAAKNGTMDKYIEARKEFVYRRTRARLKTNTEGHFGFDISTERGKDYIKDMNMALDFALLNRKVMIAACVRVIGLKLGLKSSPLETRCINRNHNHAEVDEEGFVIHRKGATHAEEGMMGVIPGNMKDGSFIVRGKGNSDSMSSSSHGAGRVLSRRKAKDQLDLEEFHKEMEGVVTNHTDATLDEAPKAYKDIYEVMDLQSDLVDVVDQVTPIINIKG